MLRIRGDFNEGFSYRTEQQIVQFDFILPDEIRQIVRQTEHDMEVTGGQEFPLSGRDPSGIAEPRDGNAQSFCFANVPARRTII
jgi:hypothetical protein